MHADARPPLRHQAVLGAGRGILSPALMNLAVVGVEPSRQGTPLCPYQATYALGMIGGPAVAGWLVERLGLDAAFALAAAASLPGLVVAGTRRPGGTARTAAEAATPR